MAFPFKTGGDFYNNQALRMCLHNLGADPTETKTGLIYFNTSDSNHGKHACLYDGSTFRPLAYMDDVADNAAFKALQDKVALLAGDVDTDAIINNMKEVSAFLAGFSEDESLMDVLNGKLDKTGGTIDGGTYAPLTIKGDAISAAIGFKRGSEANGYLIYAGGSKWMVSDEGWNNGYSLIHSGNYSDYALPKGGRGYLTIASNGRPIMANNQGYASYNTSGETEEIIWLDASNVVQIGGTVSKKTNVFGSFTINGETALHEGNIGDYTARAATMLANTLGVTYAYASDGANAIFGVKSYNTYIDGNNVYFRYGASNTNGLILNSSGNVTIGESDLAGTDYNLVVKGLSRFKNNIESDGNIIGAGAIQAKTSAHGFISLQVGSTGNKGLLDSRTSWIIYTNGTNTFLPQGNVGIGTTKPQAKLHVAGDTHITGNLIVDGQISWGGAAEEGTTSASGVDCEEIFIAVGTTSATYVNPIGGTKVQMTLYEYNSNGGTWDICLADIAVNNSQIKVTFGEATKVQHKLVIVG